jgi:hypothetical protein
MNKNLLILLIVVIIIMIIKKNKIFDGIGGIGELETQIALPVSYNSYDLRCVPKIIDNDLLKTNKFNNNPIYKLIGNHRCLI